MLHHHQIRNSGAMFVAALALLKLPAHAGSAVFSADLAGALRAEPASTVRVIVRMGTRPERAELTGVTQLGGRVTTTFSSFPGYAAEMSADALRALAGRPGKRWISLDRPVSGEGVPTTAGYSGPLDYSTKATGADTVWSGLHADGLGVGVAVLDTGVAPLPDVHVTGWVDFVNARTQPYDDNGHGTHVAGIAAGNGGSTGTVMGIAPKADVVAVKVLDSMAGGHASTVIQGLDWCIANKSRFNIRVVNLSLGQPVAQSYHTDPLCQACERAVAAGLIVVVAAGNNGGGYGGIQSPANDPDVITVGAMKTVGTAVRSDDRIASYSSRGPTAIDGLAKPDLVAPGNRIVSLRAPGSWMDQNYPENRVSLAKHGGALVQPRYYVLSGTSMAAPMVSGTCALMLERNPILTPNAAKTALMISAQTMGGLDTVLGRTVTAYDWMTEGAGYLNTAGAEQAALVFAALAPNNGVQGSISDTPVFYGQNTIQDQCVLWGDCVLWGTSALSSKILDPFTFTQTDGSVLWGDSVTFGPDAQLEGDAVAATSVLWGNHPAKASSGDVLLTGEGN